MPRTPRAEIKDKDITGLKYFAQLGGLLKELHDVGCERDRAGNRSLHMDEYQLTGEVGRPAPSARLTSTGSTNRRTDLAGRCVVSSAELHAAPISLPL